MPSATAAKPLVEDCGNASQKLIVGDALLQRSLWEAYREVIPTEQHVAVGKDSGETAHVERWNNTLRQRLGRFVRKSLSFSKSEEMHEVCLRLFLHSYNLALVSYD